MSYIIMSIVAIIGMILCYCNGKDDGIVEERQRQRRITATKVDESFKEGFNDGKKAVLLTVNEMDDVQLVRYIRESRENLFKSSKKED